MKLNKLRIRLLHLFGFGRDICHQDDISVEVSLNDMLYVENINDPFINLEEKVSNFFKKRKIKTLDIYVSYQDHLLHIDNQFMQILKLWKKL